MSDETGKLGPFGFRMVPKGYDPAQVDAFVQLVLAEDPRAGEPVFDLVRPGLDTGQVDAFLERCGYPRT